MTVAIMKPNRPMIDGAAIGVSMTRLRATHPSWSSATARSTRLRWPLLPATRSRPGW